jgi:hypothetical protein
VTFRGNFNLQGFIVFEDKNSTTSNTMDFRGSITQAPLPSSSQFDTLRSTTGVSILAPTTAVTMSGSTDSMLMGNVMVGKFTFNGAADIQVDRGTLVTYSTDTTGAATFAGKNVKFTATGASNLPTGTGISYSSNFTAKPDSYQEVAP